MVSSLCGEQLQKVNLDVTTNTVLSSQIKARLSLYGLCSVLDLTQLVVHTFCLPSLNQCFFFFVFSDFYKSEVIRDSLVSILPLTFKLFMSALLG